MRSSRAASRGLSSSAFGASRRADFVFLAMRDRILPSESNPVKQRSQQRALPMQGLGQALKLTSYSTRPRSIIHIQNRCRPFLGQTKSSAFPLTRGWQEAGAAGWITILQQRRERIPRLPTRGHGSRTARATFTGLRSTPTGGFTRGLALGGVYTWSKAQEDGDF